MPHGMPVVPPSDLRPELAPPVVPGVTELSPDRMLAVFGRERGEEEEEGEKVQDPLAMLIAEQGELLARATEMGHMAVEMLGSLVNSVIRQMKKQREEVNIIEVRSEPVPAVMSVESPVFPPQVSPVGGVLPPTDVMLPPRGIPTGGPTEFGAAADPRMALLAALAGR